MNVSASNQGRGATRPSLSTTPIEDKSLDGAILAALLLRLEDALAASEFALAKLDAQSRDLRNLRTFKKALDDAAIGKKADDDFDKSKLSNLFKVTQVVKVKKTGHSIFWSEMTKTSVGVDNRKYFESDSSLGNWMRHRRGAPFTGTQANVAVDLEQLAEFYKLTIDVKSVADISKIGEQVNNLISEESAEAQKLSTMANDRYQQVTQLVREVSGLTRSRHEGRLSPLSRL